MTDITSEKTQFWFCEKCKITGKVKYITGAGVQEVVDALFADHRLRSPGCDGGGWDIRLQNDSEYLVNR